MERGTHKFSLDRLGLGGSQTVTRKAGTWQDFTATWFTPAGGEGNGLTMRTGLKVSEKYIAVDPKLIPLGSVVELKYRDGSHEYRIAADTGGAIHGNIIDVFLWSHAAAMKNGRQKIALRVIGTVDLTTL